MELKKKHINTINTTNSGVTTTKNKNQECSQTNRKYYGLPRLRNNYSYCNKLLSVIVESLQVVATTKASKGLNSIKGIYNERMFIIKQ